MPPSPRFGEISLSFGNEWDSKSGNYPYYFETEQTQELQDSFTKIAKESKSIPHHSSVIL